MTAEFSNRKVGYLILTFAVPSFATYLGLGDALRVSEKPSEYIGLAFSILAASLFAVVSIVGDPSMLLPGNWRMGWNDAKRIQVRLMRLSWLFILYILVLALLVATEIIDFKNLTNWYFVFDVFGFLSVWAFVLSLWLPFEIKEIQITRLEQEVKARKARNGSEKGPKGQT